MENSNNKLESLIAVLIENFKILDPSIKKIVDIWVNNESLINRPALESALKHIEMGKITIENIELAVESTLKKKARVLHKFKTRNELNAFKDANQNCGKHWDDGDNYCVYTY